MNQKRSELIQDKRNRKKQRRIKRRNRNIKSTLYREHVTVFGDTCIPVMETDKKSEYEKHFDVIVIIIFQDIFGNIRYDFEPYKLSEIFLK